MANQVVLLGACVAALALTPVAGNATPIWGTWTLDSATTATVSLPDGRSASFTGFPFSVGPGGGSNVVTPAIPGVPSGGTAPLLTFYSSAAPPYSDPGEMYGSLDLGNWGVDAETHLGLEDLYDFGTFRLELLDAALNPLSLAGLQMSQHNLFYSSTGDYDVVFDPATGVLTVNRVHDSGDPNASRQSGLAIFSNLPAATRYVRLFVGGTAQFARDGQRLSLSASAVPEPVSTALLAVSALAVGSMRWARGVSPR